MKKISKNIKKSNTPKQRNLSNTIKNDNTKFDIFKLQALLEDLEKKDLEYDLIIKGLKEKINTTKHENNCLEKEIEELKTENNEINITNKRLKVEKNLKKIEIKNNIEYKNNMEKLNKNNYFDKYKEELDKNNELKIKISNIQQEINNYKNRLFELESILDYTNPEIQKQCEDMQKFLNEL